MVNVSVPLMNAIVNYLGTRPFVEVANILNAIQKELEAQKEVENGTADSL